MKMDAIKHQGRELKGTLFLEETKQNSGDIVGKSSGLNRVQVFRYIRLVELIPKLLEMVDSGRLAISVAVEISYFNKTYQQWILEYICENGMIKQEQLMDLRAYRDDDSLTQDKLIDILIKGRAIPQVRKKITFSERKLNKYFPTFYSNAEIERVIIGLLEQWKKNQGEGVKK